MPGKQKERTIAKSKEEMEARLSQLLQRKMKVIHEHYPLKTQEENCQLVTRTEPEQTELSAK